MQILKNVRPLTGLLCGALLIFLSGCGKKEAVETAVSDTRIKDEAQAFYDAHPDFFHVKTPANIPADLDWENGGDLPEIGSPDAQKGGTLNFWIQDFPRTLRIVGPDANGSFRPWILDDNVMTYAIRHPNVTDLTKDGFHYYPGLATEWALDRANKTVYIRINPQARWSDGKPITTEDVFFNFFFYRSSYIQAPWSNNFYSTKYTGVTRFDEHTFALHFPELRPDIYALALGIVPTPAHFYTELGDDFPERYQWRFAPTTGPYTVSDQDIDKGRSITLRRNKDWWAKDLKNFRYRYNPDRIRLIVIRDNAKAFEAFRKGDIDFFDLRLAEDWYDKLPDDADEVAKGYIQKIKFYNDIPRPTYGLWMNESKPLLNNRDIRAGIQYALNWELVISKFSRGDWSRMQTSADGYGDFTHPTLRARTFSIDKALDRFARAGFTTRGPDGILVNDQGQRLSVQVTTGYEHYKDVLTILQEEAIKAGVDLRIEIIDRTASWKKVQEKKHDIAFVAFNVGPEMFPRYWETNHSANAYDQAFLEDGSINPDRKVKVQTNNLQIFANHKFDQIIDAYDRSDDLEEMKTMAYQMEELIYEDASFAPGFVIPYMRHGAWNWLQVPEDGNVKIATSFEEYRMFWIDQEQKEATKAARKTGETFPPQIKIFDQYKLD